MSVQALQEYHSIKELALKVKELDRASKAWHSLEAFLTRQRTAETPVSELGADSHDFAFRCVPIMPCRQPGVPVQCGQWRGCR